MKPARAWPPAIPFLYALTDREASGKNHAAVVLDLVSAGVPVIQIREKQLSDATFCGQASAAVRAAAGHPSVVFVNDRPDLALVAGADGVHVGDLDLSVADVRRIVGSRHLVGVSTHGLEEALRAADTTADYIAVGPIFASPTKTTRQALGVEVIARIRQRTDKLIVAIGGITRERIASVVAAGASGVAVVSAVMRASNLAEAARELSLVVRAAAS